MNKLYITIGFVAMLLLQLGLPSKMIYDQHQALEAGTPYKFKTQPIDPNDPFRGKYVFLNYELDSFPNSDTTITRGQEVFVYIKTNTEGYAEATRISRDQLDIDQDYVKAEVDYAYNGKVNFSFSFNRFYMEEGKAQEAEDAMDSVFDLRIGDRDVPERLNTVCYALVYINGSTVRLADVFIDEVSIREVVLQNREKEKAATE